MKHILYSTPKRIAITLTCVLAVLITFLALYPLSAPLGVPGTDKTHHVIAFAVLMLPISVLSPRSLIWVIPVAIAYGGLIEIIQPYTGRLGDFRDFQADVVGVVIGVAAGLVARAVLPSRLTLGRSRQF